MKRLRHALLTIAGAVALTAGLAACHYLGVAHAAGSDMPAVDAVSAGADATWDMAKLDGPIWATLLFAAGLLRTFLSKQSWLAQGKLLSGLTGLSLVIAAVLAWHFAGAPASGILTALFAAYTLITHSTVPGAVPPGIDAVKRDPQAGRVSLVTLLALVVTLGTGIAVIACTSAKQRGAAGVAAFVDCETPEVSGVLPDLIPLAKDALMLAISGDGHVDTARLKADMQPAKSALVQCAIAAAVAALATPAPVVAGSPAAAALEIDGAGLRAAFAVNRQALGWAPVRLKGGAEL